MKLPVPETWETQVSLRGNKAAVWEDLIGGCPGRNGALNTFYLRLYGVRLMVKDHSDNERGKLLPPYRLLFPISSKGCFMCIIPQTG